MAIVGMHAQPINPTGNFTYNFMRETAHPTAEPEQMYGYLARNDPAMTVLEGHVPLPSPHAAELHPGWTQTGSPYMHKGEIDDMLDFGGAVGNKEEFAQVIAGKDVNRAVNIVLCGHGHFRIDYRVQWDANAQQLEQYTDHYLGNPDAYYATYYAGKEWWKVSEHKRYLVRIKEGAPPSGELLNIRDDRGTIWPDLSTMNVPPYPTPLSPSTDAKQWWQFHSPLVVQTAAIGPTSSNTRAALSTNTSAPNPVFTGFRLLQMESNVITNIQYVLAADLKNQYPLPWEPIPERLKDALEHIKDLGVAILEETSQPGQPAQPAPPQPAQPAPEPTAEPVHPMGSPVVRDHRTHH
jgi:hypothetical protein